MQGLEKTAVSSNKNDQQKQVEEFCYLIIKKVRYCYVFA